MREGLYLGQAPVNVRRGGARRLAFSLMRGGSSYSNAAGGFHQVPAFPPLQTFRGQSAANRDVRMVELYASQPGLFKQKLENQFRLPRDRVTSGVLRSPVAQIGANPS